MSILKNTQTGSHTALTLESMRKMGYVFYKYNGEPVTEPYPTRFIMRKERYKEYQFGVILDPDEMLFTFSIPLTIDEDGASGTWVGAIQNIKDLSLVENYLEIIYQIKHTSKILVQSLKYARIRMIENITTYGSILSQKNYIPF